jgi:hypothetical protein
VSFATALFSMMILGWLGTGIIAYASYKISPMPITVALSVMIMLDMMRTWIVGFLTAFYRGKAGMETIPFLRRSILCLFSHSNSGKVKAEEDRVMPGIESTEANTSLAVLADTLQEIQTKDGHVQLALYFTVHTIAGVVSTSGAAEGAYIAFLVFFFVSRIAYMILAILGVRPLLVSITHYASIFIISVLLFWNLVQRIRSFT